MASPGCSVSTEQESFGLSSRDNRVTGFSRYQEHRATRRAHTIELEPTMSQFSVIERELSNPRRRHDHTPRRRSLLHSITRRLHDPVDVETSAARGALARDVNRRVRTALLGQRYWSNRFVGRAEEEYQLFISQYRRCSVSRRLAVAAVLLGLSTVYDAVVNQRPASFVALRTAAPVALLVVGSLLCRLRATRRWWRLAAVVAACCAYGSVLSADAVEPDGAWEACDKDANSVWQLLWLIAAMACSALFFALDLPHVCACLALQLATYLAGSLALQARWWRRAGRGEWRLPSLVLGPPAGLQLGRDEDASSRMVVDCILSAGLALLLLLCAARMRDQHERQCFINSYVLHARVSKQHTRIGMLQRKHSPSSSSSAAARPPPGRVSDVSRRHAELLALFSNPRVPDSSPLELKFLMRALPHEHLAVEPAASIGDLAPAVLAHNPRIILFSGHSFMGSLAFELDDGRIDLPPAAAFISQLSREAAPRLQCVFLNGCHTAALGHKLVEEMPWLCVICWCSITEDAAARAFATGFYDAVGDFIFNEEQIRIELAYWLGLKRMYDQGFRLGDPATYLHPPGHPHHSAPVFRGCDGCCPPVHGNVVLLASFEKRVCVLRPSLPSQADEPRRSTPPVRSTPPRLHARLAAHARRLSLGAGPAAHREGGQRDSAPPSPSAPLDGASDRSRSASLSSALPDSAKYSARQLGGSARSAVAAAAGSAPPGLAPGQGGGRGGARLLLDAVEPNLRLIGCGDARATLHATWEPVDVADLLEPNPLHCAVDSWVETEPSRELSTASQPACLGRSRRPTGAGTVSDLPADGRQRSLSRPRLGRSWGSASARLGTAQSEASRSRSGSRSGPLIVPHAHRSGSAKRRELGPDRPAPMCGCLSDSWRSTPRVSSASTDAPCPEVSRDGSLRAAEASYLASASLSSSLGAGTPRLSRIISTDERAEERQMIANHLVSHSRESSGKSDSIDELELGARVSASQPSLSAM